MNGINQNKMIDLLQDAWCFESKLLELIESHLGASVDSRSRRLYGAHAAMTRKQRSRIEQRLLELGSQPECQPGWFTTRLRRLAKEVETTEFWHEHATQLMITSYGIKQVECRMYGALFVAAKEQEDHVTASLAHTSLEEEEATARRLLFCIGQATRSRVAA